MLAVELFMVYIVSIGIGSDRTVNLFSKRINVDFYSKAVAYAVIGRMSRNLINNASTILMNQNPWRCWVTKKKVSSYINRAAVAFAWRFVTLIYSDYSNNQRENWTREKRHRVECAGDKKKWRVSVITILLSLIDYLERFVFSVLDFNLITV